MSMLAFARRNARPLAFGAIHAFYSAPGQTYVIGLFIAAISATLGLSVSEIGALYLAATLASAASLVFVGYWIDHIRLVHFSGAVVLGLAAACFATSLAAGPLTLFVAFYLLRLTGQGLMMHVEGTATARTFDADRGRALSITALGTPLSEVVFPPLAIAAVATIGWRPTYAAMGVVALVVVLPVTQWLLRTFRRAPPGMTKPDGEGQKLVAGLVELVRSRYVLLMLPALAVFPFHVTAIMFHITAIAADRGWSAAVMALSFPVLATASVAGLFISGFLVDRISARRVFPYVLMPMLLGLAVMAAFRGAWSMPVGFALIGFGGGLSRTSMTAIWAELFGVRSLGAIRSAITMFMVFASGVSPFVTGLAFDAGFSVSSVLWVLVAYGVVAVAPLLVVRPPDRAGG